MIKVHHSLEHLDTLAEEHYNYIRNGSQFLDFLDDNSDGPAEPFLTYVLQNLRQIITGRPAILESMIGALDAVVAISKLNYLAQDPTRTQQQSDEWFSNLALSLFNYDKDHMGFTRRYDGRKAYELSIKLNISTCPYCNAQFTFTFDVALGKSRPQFDHFLYKARYPYFALSFFNLIPSCSVCNASLKGSELFSITSHLHPYLEGMEGGYKFETKISSADFLVDKKEFELHFVERDNADAGLITRSNGSIKEFALKDRYQFHRDYAGDIIKSAHLYTYTTIASIIDGFKWEGNPVFASPEEGVETIMGNYLSERNLHRRILSKLAKDIAEEFGVRLPII